MKQKLLTFGRLLVNRAQKSDIARWSVSIAYYITLSLFPLLIVLGTVLPYFNISADTIVPYLDSVIPAPLLQVIGPTIENMLTVPKGGLLSLGILVTIWSASKGMNYVQKGVDGAYGLTGTRFYITSRIASIVTFIVIIVLFIAFMLASTFGQPLLESLLAFFGWDSGILRHYTAIKWLVTAGGMLLTFMLIYRITPNIKHRFRDVLPGAALAAVCLMVLVQLYAFYLGLSSSLTAYGVLSGIFVLMVWLRLLGYIVLLGAVLNATLFEMKHGPPQPKDGRFNVFIQRGVDRAADWFKTLVGVKPHQGPPPDDGQVNNEKGEE